MWRHYYVIVTWPKFQNNSERTRAVRDYCDHAYETLLVCACIGLPERSKFSLWRHYDVIDISMWNNEGTIRDTDYCDHTYYESLLVCVHGMHRNYIVYGCMTNSDYYVIMMSLIFKSEIPSTPWGQLDYVQYPLSCDLSRDCLATRRVLRLII